MADENYQTRLRQYAEYLDSEAKDFSRATIKAIDDFGPKPTPEESETISGLRRSQNVLDAAREELYSLFPELKERESESGPKSSE